MKPKAVKADIASKLVDKFSEFEKELNGHSKSPMHSVRKNALEDLKSHGLPGPKDEEYKYTHLVKSIEKHIDLDNVSNHCSLSDAEIDSFIFDNEDANIIVFVNGVYSAPHSNIISPVSDLIVLDFEEAFMQHPEEVIAHFGNYAAKYKDPFTSVNTAFSRNGAFVKVAPGKVIEKPVMIHFISDTRQGTPVYYPRNLFIIGEHSEVNIIESFQTFGEQPSLVNQVTEIVVSKDAKGSYYKLQLESDKAQRVDNTQIHQRKDSVFNTYTFTFGGNMVRNNLNIALEDPHCESHMYGLYLMKGNAHVDNHTVVDHIMPESFSNENYKGILDDKSTGVFNGKIFVRQDAQKTNAFQSNKNILLTDDAKMNTKPQLEIWADDVKCSHGCTTGQLDDEQMFYLRSRGISAESARAILLHAFAADVLETVKFDFIREHLDRIIHERLH